MMPTTPGGVEVHEPKSNRIHSKNISQVAIHKNADLKGVIKPLPSTNIMLGNGFTERGGRLNSNEHSESGYSD